MLNEQKPYCQMAGCRSTTEVRAIEVDLVDSWEASPRFTTATIHVALCASCAGEAERRVVVTLQARAEFYELLRIITAAVPYERELGAARQQLRETEAELRLARALRGLDQRRVVARALDVALNSLDGSYRP